MYDQGGFKPWSRLRYVAENGEVAEIIPRYFIPLTYSDVVERHNDHRIECVADSVILKDRSNEKTSGTFSTSIIFRNPTSIYALVEGGWLPLPFVHSRNFMVDRNVVSTLAKIANGSIRQDVQHTNWWLSFLNNPSVTINPILCAWEGDSRRVPAYSEFCDHFDKASEQISAVLPKIKVIKFQDKHYRAAYATIIDLSTRQEREAQFLLYAIPLIQNKVSTSELKEYQGHLVKKAHELGLKTGSLAVIAVFSCLFEKVDGPGYLVGRRILKPCRGYTKENAYNALSDLRSLELFICSHGFEQEPMSLCTCDRAIAAFWCLVNPHSITYENGKFTYSVAMSEDLFPRLPSDQLESFINALR